MANSSLKATVYFPAGNAGAADDAAQASVMLEAARALLARLTDKADPADAKTQSGAGTSADPAGSTRAQQLQLLASPVTFLWTGGEEPVSPVRASCLLLACPLHALSSTLGFRVVTLSKLAL
jgi:hypothetical protein